MTRRPNRLGPRPVTSTGSRCVVAGCAEAVEAGTLICRRHSEALRRPAPACDGLCVLPADVGVPAAGVAYPHPGCPLHAPGDRCECGQPDRCLSPTHGQITMAEAQHIRHRQRRSAWTDS